MKTMHDDFEELHRAEEEFMKALRESSLGKALYSFADFLNQILNSLGNLLHRRGTIKMRDGVPMGVYDGTRLIKSGVITAQATRDMKAGELLRDGDYIADVVAIPGCGLFEIPPHDEVLEKKRGLSGHFLLAQDQESAEFIQNAEAILSESYHERMIAIEGWIEKTLASYLTHAIIRKPGHLDETHKLMFGDVQIGEPLIIKFEMDGGNEDA